MSTRSTFRTFFGWAILGILLAVLPPLSSAQYQVFIWENFETGQFPDSLTRMLQASSRSAQVVDFAAEPNRPEGLITPNSLRECGRFGFAFRCGGDEVTLSTVSDLPLHRSRLGEGGYALFQADLWIPPAGIRTPNIAVLAIAHGDNPDGSDADPWKCYRWGLSGTGQHLFFSILENQHKSLLFKRIPVGELISERPGWRRFQVIFEGEDKIHCAVDGKRASFSPIIDKRFMNVRPGLMAVMPENTSGVAYADNLSVQWSPVSVPIPDSPWVMGSGGAPIFAPGGTAVVPVRTLEPGLPGIGVQPPPAPQAPPPAALAWLDNPEEAWNRSVAERRPLLALFYAPRAAAFHGLQGMFQSEPGAHDILRRFTLLRIEANQLSGGALAQQMNVFRVPALIVFDNAGREMLRLTVDGNTMWSDIAQALLTVVPAVIPN